MDELETVERAAAFWAAGRRAEALSLLKGRVRDAPAEESARRALVAFYRELRAPDQAGRWAVALGEWATPLERDRTARLLAASSVAVPDMPGFLALPEGGLPACVVELLPEVDRYRGEFRLAAKKRIDAAMPDDDWRSAIELAAWALSLVVVVVAAAVSWVGAVLDLSTTDVVRWACVVSLVLLAVACGFAGWTQVGRRRRAIGAAWFAGALAIAVGVAVVVSRAVDGGGVIRLVWER